VRKYLDREFYAANGIPATAGIPVAGSTLGQAKIWKSIVGRGSTRMNADCRG
jgi:hypothetical protein